MSRYHQQRRTVHEMVSTGRNLIADYTFAKDSLFARINLKGDELDMYYKVHEALAEKIEKPDLLVYLQATTDTLMQRIALRDRPYERQMERAYIHELNLAYDEFFSKPFDQTPVLTIDSNNLNVIQNPGHLRQVEERIRQSLNLPPFQQALPSALRMEVPAQVEPTPRCTFIAPSLIRQPIARSMYGSNYASHA